MRGNERTCEGVRGHGREREDKIGSGRAWEAEREHGKEREEMEGGVRSERCERKLKDVRGNMAWERTGGRRNELKDSNGNGRM